MTTSVTDTLHTLLTRFAVEECCWFASTRPDGRAHLAPIWHVWHEGCAYVVTQPTSVRAKNIAANPHVSLSWQDPVNPLIIEGTARPAPEMQDELRPLFQAKYDWDISTDADYSLILQITPTKFMAWGAYGEGRWHC